MYKGFIKILLESKNQYIFLSDTHIHINVIFDLYYLNLLTYLYTVTLYNRGLENDFTCPLSKNLI